MKKKEVWERIADSHPNIGVFVAIYKGGKSYLIKSLQRRLVIEKRIERIYVFSQVLHNGDYDHLPDGTKYSQYDNTIMQKLAQIMLARPRKTLIVFDDSGRNDWNTAWFKDFIGRFRHYGGSIWFTCREVTQVPVDVRTTATFACIFKRTTTKSKKEAYDCFGQEMKKDDFYEKVSMLKPRHFLFYERGAEHPYQVATAEPVPENFKIKTPSKAPARQ